MNRSERRAAAQAQRPQVQEAQPPGLHQRAFFWRASSECHL